MILRVFLVILTLVSSSYCSTLKGRCGKDKFPCDDGTCINRSWRCDRKHDCADASDESYCEYSRQYGSYGHTSCPERYYKCSGHHCIPQEWRCDGVKDCADGKDESQCQTTYCNQPNMFTCSNKLCIPESAICDGNDDCKDNSDEQDCFTGVLAVSGVEQSRKRGIAWLKLKRNRRWGWDENTHRAIVTFFLAEEATFNGTKREEELMAKQLELEVAVALLRNDSDPLPRNRLAFYINALLVTCRNPRNFYGFNLVTLLKNRILMKENTTHPLVYLALCNAKEVLSNDVVDSLFSRLEHESEYLFWIDIQAMTVMALTCITNQSRNAHLAQNISSTIENFKRKQRADGSFGNVYTSALVVQALLATGHEDDKDWDVSGAVKYLQSKQTLSDGSFGDVLATYLVLPILKRRTLTDIAHVKCNSLRRQLRNGKSIVDIKNKLGPKMYIQYSLYIGEAKDVIHTLSLRVPANVTVYHVMRFAVEADSKYKFEYKITDDKIYVYSIANIANDSENGVFWLLFLSDAKSKEPVLNTQSPDKVTVTDGDHIIMWYKTAGTDP